MATIYLTTSNVLELQNLEDATGGSPTYINDATVTATVTDKKSGDTVSGETFPVTLSYVSGTNSTYRKVLSSSMSLTKDKRYTATITATSGSFTRTFTLDLIAAE